MLARHCCTLTEEVGIAAVGAMELLVEVGDPTRFADVRPFLPAITRNYVARVGAYAAERAASVIAS